MDESSRFADSYYEIRIFIPESVHDAVGSFIVDNFAQGLFLDDSSRPGLIGVGFYMPYGDISSVKESILKYARLITPDFKIEDNHISIKLVVTEDWQEKFRRSIRPIAIDNIYIRPTWENRNPDCDIDIVIEPRMAFGTGHHESTSLCLKAIKKYIKAGQGLFDLGCGSGILSIAAAKFGAKPVMAVDIDLAAVENARENATLNGLEDKIIIEYGSIEKSGLSGLYDIIAANIIKSTLIDLMPDIYKAASKKGIIILSGLLAEDEDEFMELLKSYELSNIEKNFDGEWLSLVIFK